MNAIRRREFVKHMGISAAAMPFLLGLPSLGLAAPARPRQRVVGLFSPNGTIPTEFWPDEEGSDFKLKKILSPLEAYKDKMLILHGLSNKLRGDGDGHQRGMSCLLTGIELFPGNIMGGSGVPAGWASGISIDRRSGIIFRARKRRARGLVRWSLASASRTAPIPGRGCPMPGRTSRWRQFPTRTRCTKSCTARCRTSRTCRACWAT
jgi:hypothetical protein